MTLDMTDFYMAEHERLYLKGLALRVKLDNTPWWCWRRRNQLWEQIFAIVDEMKFLATAMKVTNYP